MTLSALLPCLPGVHHHRCHRCFPGVSVSPLSSQLHFHFHRHLHRRFLLWPVGLPNRVAGRLAFVTLSVLLLFCSGLGTTGCLLPPPHHHLRLQHFRRPGLIFTPSVQCGLFSFPPPVPCRSRAAQCRAEQCRAVAPFPACWPSSGSGVSPFRPPRLPRSVVCFRACPTACLLGVLAWFLRDDQARPFFRRRTGRTGAFRQAVAAYTGVHRPDGPRCTARLRTGWLGLL